MRVLSSTVWSSATGIGDVEVTLKRLMAGDGRERVAVVLGLEGGLPTGNEADELGEGAWELTPFVALLRDFGSWSLQGNAGWSTQLGAGSGDGESAWLCNVALATPEATSRFHFIAELNGAWSDSAGASPLSAACGAKWQVGEGGFFALAVPVGLNSDAEDWGVVTQYQFQF